MPIRYVKGDIFLSNCQTWGHGCNTRGRMGAGVAVGFRSRFPEMFREYRRLCHLGKFIPGDYFLFKSPTRWILNLATQDSTHGAMIEFVDEALRNFSTHAEDEGILSLALPRIASGLGGQEWAQVKALMEYHLGGLSFPAYIYEEFEEGAPADESL